jgi:asparagine synthase (glutamine-hydrolysing)
MLKEATRYFKRSVQALRTRVSLQPEDRELIERIRAAKLTYLHDQKLAEICNTCRALEESGTPGMFLEAGCALGGSSILIGTIKEETRPFQVYDVFGMIPPPTDEDTADVHERYRKIVGGESVGIKGDTYYGYLNNLYDLVKSNLRRFGLDPQRRNISLIKGLVQDTLQISEPVAFAHVDVDWYEPVMTCLERIGPQLSVGGSIILDDYHDWGGCRKATDQYLSEHEAEFATDDRAGSLKLTRVI